MYYLFGHADEGDGQGGGVPHREGGNGTQGVGDPLGGGRGRGTDRGVASLTTAPAIHRVAHATPILNNTMIRGLLGRV